MGSEAYPNTSFHPALNGLAERAVGMVKDRLKKMDVPGTPVELHVGLKYIGRVHGLTPHRSTGRCPYELIKESQLPSMFPRLTSGSEERSQSTAVRHSVARQRSKQTFAEGEKVVIYDNRFKISSAGKILEVLGNNTYLADCGKGPQHVSGDCISREPDVATRQVGEGQRVQPQHVRDDDDDDVVDVNQ